MTAKYYLILSSLITTLLITVKFKRSYHRSEDSFPLVAVVVPCIFVAILPCCRYAATTVEILWAFSIFMEAAATLPQVWMLRKTKATWGFLSVYLLLLGLYRGFYLINWVWRYEKDGHFDPIAILPAIVHVLLCTAGFYIGIRKKQSRERMRADEDASSRTQGTSKMVSFSAGSLGASAAASTSASKKEDGNVTGDEEEGGFGFGDENDN